MKLSPQTQEVLIFMRSHSTVSQIQCADERITLRLSNKIRELESRGFMIGRERMGAHRKDYRYWIITEPPEIPSRTNKLEFEAKINVEPKRTLFS